MKFLTIPTISCIILCSLLTISAWSQVAISTPISITDGDDSFGYKSPRLAINAAGEPMVFWMRTGNEAFFMSTLTSSGFTVPTEIPLNGLNPNLWSGSLGPDMAAQGDDVYVTFEIYGDAIYTIHSADAGQTWEAPVEAYIPTQGRRATIPNVAVDNAGQPYVSYVNTNTSEGDAYYGMVRSTDFGQTFLAEVEVSALTDGAEVCECCNGHIEIADNGDVYVGFRNNNSNLRDIWIARSTDGGSTFNAAFDVDDTDWNINACPSNGPNFIVTDDEVVTTFFSGAGVSGSSAYFSAFDIQSESLTGTYAIVPAESSSTNLNRPKIAGDGENLAIVWQEIFDGSTEIAMSYSTTGSSGITMENILLTDLEFNQQYPTIAFYDGMYHVVYEDLGTGTLLYQSVTIGAVGLSEVETELFSISPNPCSDILQVQRNSNEQGHFRMFDTQGRIVLQQALGTVLESISVEHIVPGIYLCVYQDGNLSEEKMLLIQ